MCVLCFMQSSLADLPLKNYYRFVVPSLDDFSNVDYSVNGPKAFFSNMPLSKTLTMNLDVPEPWLVEPVVAMYVACRSYCFLFDLVSVAVPC